MPNYQVFVNGQGQGPYTPDQLLQSGLNAETLVWTDGMPQWTPARLVPELAARLGVPMSSPMTMYPQHVPARAAGSGNGLKWGSVSCMAVALVCFFLPFFSVSCTATGQKLLSFSGTQLAFGGEADVKDPTADLGGSARSGTPSPGSSTVEKKEKVNGDGRAIVAFIMTALGVGLAFLPRKAGAGAVLVCALMAAVAMFALKMKIDDEVGVKLKEMGAAMSSGAGGSGSSSGPGASLLGGAEPLKLEYGAGFFLPMALYVAVAIMGVIGLTRKPGATAAQPGMSPG